MSWRYRYLALISPPSLIPTQVEVANNSARARVVSRRTYFVGRNSPRDPFSLHLGMQSGRANELPRLVPRLSSEARPDSRVLACARAHS